MFPGVVGLGGQGLAGVVEDVALRTTCLEIFNDASAEIQAGSGNRLLPMALLPAWDIDLCVREVQRAKDLGLRGVNLTSDPQDLGAPDLASPEWDPVWDACSSLGLPVHFHIGASLTTMNYFGTYPWPRTTTTPNSPSVERCSSSGTPAWSSTSFAPACSTAFPT